MTAAFIKAVTSGDNLKAMTILEEFGKDISLEARDKNGKTLLMV